MIALLCTLEPARIAWLPQLVRHYRGIGVERFLLILQLEPDAGQPANDRDYARFRETLAGLGIDFVRGVLIDRVAADYSLPAFDPQTPLWDTFPRTCNVTTALAAGDLRKVVLARGDVIVSGGKHEPRPPRNPNTFTGWVQVHHFKWEATLLERLRYRVRPQWQAEHPWWGESQRLLDHFAANGSRFNPADLTPITLNGPHFVAFQ